MSLAKDGSETMLQTLKEEFAQASDPSNAVIDYDRVISLREQIKHLESSVSKAKKDALVTQKREEERELRKATSKLKHDMVNRWDEEERERQEKCTKELQRMEYNHLLAAQRLEKELEVASASAQSKMKPSAKLISLREKEATLVKSQIFEEAKDVHMQVQELEEEEIMQYRARLAKFMEKKRQRLKESQDQELKVLRHRLLVEKEETTKKRVQQARLAQGRIKISKVKLGRNHKRDVVDTKPAQQAELEPAPVLQTIHNMNENFAEKPPAPPTDLSHLIDFDDPVPTGTVIVHAPSNATDNLRSHNTRRRLTSKRRKNSLSGAGSNIINRGVSSSSDTASSGTQAKENRHQGLSSEEVFKAVSKVHAQREDGGELVAKAKAKGLSHAELELQRQFDALLMSEATVGDIEKTTLDGNAKAHTEDRYAATEVTSPTREAMEAASKQRAAKNKASKTITGARHKKEEPKLRKMNNTYAGLMEEKRFPSSKLSAGRRSRGKS